MLQHGRTVRDRRRLRLQRHRGGRINLSGAVATSQPNGPNTFPLEITQFSADGLVTIKRRFTGNSFVAVGGLFDLNGDGVSCSTMAECGNCTNRTVHILTTVTNNTGAFMTVRYVEHLDTDISATFTDDRAAKTADAVMAWEDLDDPGASGASRGLLMQSLILPATTAADFCCGYVSAVAFSPPAGADCNFAVGTPFVTPTGPTDPAIMIRQDLLVSPFGDTAGNFRTHVRRF